MNFPFFHKQRKWNTWRLTALALVIFLAGLGSGFYLYREQIVPRPDEKKGGPVEQNSTVKSTQKQERNEQEFIALKEQLDSPAKIAAYIKDNFTITAEESQTALAPGELFSRQAGGPQDIAVFTSFILDYHGYETGVFEYAWSEDGRRRYHSVAVFRDKDTPKYLVAVPGSIELVAHGWSFKDLIEKEETRTDITIEEYAFFEPGQTNLTTADWAKNK